MIKVSIKTKKGNIHNFFLNRGDDFLSTLDKFLKMHKINLSDFVDVSVDCKDFESSVSCRIAKISAEAIKLIKLNNNKQ